MPQGPGSGTADLLVRYLLATRPAFLTVTLLAVLLGLAGAYHTGIAIQMPAAALTVLGALLAHAGVNVINDYQDALNGTDALNVDRVAPYTGGSRFIQDGLLTTRATAWYGAALLATTMTIGSWLLVQAGTGLLMIGIAGLLIGWGYSAPPLRLNSRGWGEPAVWCGFALLVAGADYVQRKQFASTPWIVAGSYALLVTNLLFINEFPDRRADEQAGKRHWVVRLGARRARGLYAVIAAASAAWLVAAVGAGILPKLALLALASEVLSWRAGVLLWQRAQVPRELAPAIRATIAAALLHGACVALALVFAPIEAGG
jgi:1,4-dihydroxy-2-naphthoate octaprenyltransferase